MSYRPICDTWILARAKLKDGRKYYGSYPGGFLERARALLGVSINDAVLHVCGGMSRYYPYRGFGDDDATLDLDPAAEPTFLQDAREPFPVPHAGYCHREWYHSGWPAILIDPPYTLDDADHYAVGRDVLPSANLLLRHGLEAVMPGGRVGMLHYLLPQPPKPAVVGFETKFVAAVGVIVGFNNRIRVYSVYERLA